VTLVSLSSDFGAGSPYVATMKALILSRCPEATLIDLSHQLQAFRPEAAAFTIWAGTASFPESSVHLAVVDPGVGGRRQAVALRVGGSWYVGPDNGVFGLVLATADQDRVPVVEAWSLKVPDGASPTFHGRDVFAPAAAHLAGAGPASDLGQKLDPAGLQRVALDPPRVLFADNFGNLVTSLRGPLAGVRLGGHDLRVWASTYAEAEFGVPFLYVGSTGLIEIGLREARADQALEADVGSLLIPIEDEQR